MRDIARIDRILDRLRRIWVKQPDTRLGQLLVNAAPTFEGEAFYLEDDRLETALRAYEVGT